MIEKLTGTSLDIPADNRAKLKQFFPSVFTEAKNQEGELVETLDFEKLKAELGTFTDLFESRRERYGMDWPGKKEALHLIQTPSSATLKPCREESVNFDNTENLFIEGDNLEVLKLLQKSYYNKVKMIYIDPPYNTGNEFIYPDNFSESLETYLEYAGLIDGDGKKFSTNTANEGRFHTKWLNMMYPRLYLARNLLKDDGVIFISIDDNEVSNLRKLCDEVFGEENFIECVVWKKRYGGGAKEKYLVSVHEYILCYTKNINYLLPLFIPQTKESIERYYTQRDDNFEKMGPYRTHPLEATKSMGDRPNLIFPIIAPDGSEIMPKRQWLWSKVRVTEELKKGAIAFLRDKDNNWSVHSKQYLKDESGNIRQSKAFSIIDDVFSQHGTNEIIDLFGEAQTFSFPKPSKLIQPLLNLALTAEDSDIILDFFAGSATTAHAVLDLNKQDNGNRKFILVQLPEPCAPDSEAFRAGYKTIADIGKERIRRVIKKLTEGDPPKMAQKHADQKQIDLFESHLIEPIPSTANSSLDLGFKVLKLDKSNFKLWQKLDPSTPVEKIEAQLELFVDHIVPKATQEDLLYEILLKAGFTPTEKIEIKNISGKKVFSVSDGGFFLCLEDTVTKELVDAVAEAEPTQFICLDSAFHGNDQLKANAVQTFAACNMQREKHNRIIFRTV